MAHYRITAVKYALLIKPIDMGGGLLVGRVLSRHRTLLAMARALERAQAPTRRANPGCHLDIQPVELVDRHHGRLLINSNEWLDAMFDASERGKQ